MRDEAHTSSQSRAGTGLPLGTLISELLGEISTLLRGEIRLAQAEMKREAVKLRSAGLWFAAAGFFAFSAFLALLASAHYALIAAGLPPYAAAGAIGVIAILGAGLSAWAGVSRLKSLNSPLERTAHQTAQDVRMIKESL